METTEPELFNSYPNLKEKVPWIHLLTNIPSPIDRLTELENYLDMSEGKIYIKRDDKDHSIYGGNKLRKFEFIVGNVIKQKKKGIVTIGGIGTNHGIACAIVCRELGLKCHLFLSHQPLTWHVQRSLLLYDYFGATLHHSKSFEMGIFKSLIFKLFHPSYFLMSIGGTPLFGVGTPLGTIGFINAIFELKVQIDNGIIPEPDAIFVPGGSSGTASGLVAGCKLAGLKTKINMVNVSRDIVVNNKAVIKNANKAIKYLRKRDKSIPNVKVSLDDFKMIKGYLGSAYGVKTVKGQNAIDIVMKLEGYKRDFKLDTTYTGKTLAGLIDYMKKEENSSKKVIFWNTLNSNDLDKYLKETNFNYKKLPKKFHRFFEEATFQCWQIANCSEELREKCPAYLNYEYRFWRITECSLDEQDKNKAREVLSNVIQLEDA